MRFIHYILLVSLAAIAGCRNQTSGANDSASGAHDPGAQSPGSDGFGSHGAAVSDSLAQKAMNSYTGHLGDGLITVVINYISGDAVSGYAIQRGRRRNFNGDVHLQGAVLHFRLEEAGDQPGKFTFHLDTVSWKMSGQASCGEESWPLKAVKPTGWRYGLNNTWVSAGVVDFRDSILTLGFDGLCDFKFYERPWDSTSQMITIRGNYERLGGNTESYRVEWEENSYLKAASDVLVVKEEKIRNYTRTVLTGNAGLRLVRFSML